MNRDDAIAALLDKAIRPFVSPRSRGAAIEAVQAALAAPPEPRDITPVRPRGQEVMRPAAHAVSNELAQRLVTADDWEYDLDYTRQLLAIIAREAARLQKEPPHDPS